MAKVFISYRRADSATFSGRIYDRLIAKYGRKNVFKDVDDVPAGVNFGSYIQDSLRQCAVALIIIGPHWLDQEAADGGRRLDDAKDWVRVEVETAFALGLTVIPTLVDGVQMPKGTDLPETLQELTQINSVSVRNDPDFVRDMDRLIAAIDRAFASKPSGGFLGRRSTPSQAKTPPPAQPTATTPSPTPLPVAAPAPPGAVVSPPVAVGVAEKPHPAKEEGKEGNGRSGLAGNRALIAGLAALLVIVAFGGLLTNRVLTSIQAGNAAETQSAIDRANANASATSSAVNATAAASATTAYAPTATFLAKPLYPYFAAAPGPNCDTGRATWSANNGTGGVTCASDHTHLVGQDCGTGNCDHGITVYWSSPPELGTSQAANYTVSVQISHVALANAVDDAYLWLDLSNGASYSFLLLGDGQYSFRRYNSNVQVASGSFTVSSTHTLSFSVQGAKVAALIDSRQVGSHTESASMTVASIKLGLDGVGSPFPSADFANFMVNLQS